MIVVTLAWVFLAHHSQPNKVMASPYFIGEQPEVLTSEWGLGGAPGH